MADIPIEGKLKPLLVGGKVADGVDVEIDATGFDGNLDTNDTNLQLVAQALDDLTVGGMGGSGSFYINYSSDNRTYARSNKQNFTTITTSLPIKNDEVEITGGQINIYAQSGDVTNMFVRVEDNSTGDFYFNDMFTATTDQENVEDFGALVTAIPSDSTTQIDLGISIASDDNDQVRCGSIRLDFNYR
jgi:hypothetical protein